MRWIFFSLILANAMAFMWQWGERDRNSTPLPRMDVVPSNLEGVPEIKLLSELDGSALASMRNSAPQPTQRFSQSEPSTRLRLGDNKGRSADEPLCTLVGPFPRMLKAEYFVERMAALEISAAVQEVEIPGETGYWVHLPPEISKKEALRRLHELQAKGIDSYVIPKGELTNGISFGMFSQKDLALKRQQQMQAEGYGAAIKEVSRSYKEIWAILQPAEARKLSDELWQTVLPSNPEMERRQNFCPGVASADNFH